MANGLLILNLYMNAITSTHHSIIGHKDFVVFACSVLILQILYKHIYNMWRHFCKSIYGGHKVFLS